MSSKRTADPDSHDRDRDRKKRRSSHHSDGAAAAPPLQPAPPPNHGVGAALSRIPPVIFWRQPFSSDSGHSGLSIWRARWSNVRPPLSFQVYVTFDVSDWTNVRFRAFAQRLWYHCTPPLPSTEEEWQRWEQNYQLPQLLAHEPHSLPIRLDIIILGAPSSEKMRNLTCMQHYRMSRDLNERRMYANDGTADFYWPPAPSCRGPNGVQYGGFLIQVFDAENLGNMGLKLLYFDAEEGAADLSQAETETGSTGSTADDGVDDPAMTLVQGGGNLWARELCYTWETMSMVKEWRDSFYETLAEQFMVSEAEVEDSRESMDEEERTQEGGEENR